MDSMRYKNIYYAALAYNALHILQCILLVSPMEICSTLDRMLPGYFHCLSVTF